MKTTILLLLAFTLRSFAGVPIGTNSFGFPIYAIPASANTNAIQFKWIHVTWTQPSEQGTNKVLTLIWKTDDLSSTNWQFVEGIPQGMPGDLYFPNAPGCCFYKGIVMEFICPRKYQSASLVKPAQSLMTR